jgi:hypothetical protein
MTPCVICGSPTAPPARVCSLPCARKRARARTGETDAPPLKPTAPPVSIGDVPTYGRAINRGPMPPAIVRPSTGEALPVSIDVWWTEEAGALTLHCVQSNGATPANAVRIVLAAPIVGARPHYDLTWNNKKQGSEQ